MRRLADDGLVETPRTFARNRLEILVAPGNPKHVNTLADLARTDLKVASISASADGLTTPADIEASKAKLPPTTTYVVVDGGNHSWFGDYGDQADDGVATGDRVAGQQLIATSTQALLASLVPPPPKKKKKK